MPDDTDTLLRLGSSTRSERAIALSHHAVVEGTQVPSSLPQTGLEQRELEGVEPMVIDALSLMPAIQPSARRSLQPTSALMGSFTAARSGATVVNVDEETIQTVGVLKHLDEFRTALCDGYVVMASSLFASLSIANDLSIEGCSSTALFYLVPWFFYLFFAVVLAICFCAHLLKGLGILSTLRHLFMAHRRSLLCWTCDDHDWDAFREGHLQTTSPIGPTSSSTGSSMIWVFLVIGLPLTCFGAVTLIMNVFDGSSYCHGGNGGRPSTGVGASASYFFLMGCCLLSMAFNFRPRRHRQVVALGPDFIYEQSCVGTGYAMHLQGGAAQRSCASCGFHHLHHCATVIVESDAYAGAVMIIQHQVPQDEAQDTFVVLRHKIHIPANIVDNVKHFLTRHAAYNYKGFVHANETGAHTV